MSKLLYSYFTGNSQACLEVENTCSFRQDEESVWMPFKSSKHLFAPKITCHDNIYVYIFILKSINFLFITTVAFPVSTTNVSLHIFVNFQMVAKLWKYIFLQIARVKLDLWDIGHKKIANRKWIFCVFLNACQITQNQISTFFFCLCNNFL